MKITAISDLHGRKPDLPGGDLLIIAGDCTARDTIPEWIDFFEWLEAQDYEKKILVGGNHDGFLAQSLSTKECTELFPKEKDDWKYDYLLDSDTEFRGLKLYGSPWTKSFKGVNPKCKEFMEDELTLSEKFKLIPNDIDILITHSPAYGFLDESDDGRHLGCKALTNEIDRVKPKISICGHIHSGMGFLPMKDTMYINASMVDNLYQKQLDYMEIILDDEGKLISVTEV